MREPGKLMAYSNYSTALAGAIVAQVSGMEYESYVEQNILAPLGLAHTTFREQYAPTEGLPQPMSAELAAHMAQNIESRDGRWQTVPHEHIVSMAPAGAAVSTAADMARYMLALLDPQQLEAAGVLKAETFAQMREPSFQSAPGMPAMHHGFFNTPLGMTDAPRRRQPLARRRDAALPVVHGRGDRRSRCTPALTNAPRPAGHGERHARHLRELRTARPGSSSCRALPERISPNTSRVREAHGRRGFAAHLEGRDYVGQYRSNRRSYTSFEKILSLPAVATVSRLTRTGCCS